ncbi:MAG TPA: cysteine-rich CWC family protein [Pyrinomonadaceae bacterium]|nr:cysteine-rich CWC family protein [Pyrinomonadaceae bacterium]
MSLKKLMGIALPQFREPSTCEACGAKFVCGATLAGCWCSEIKLSAEARAKLSRRYEHCLCRSCLESFAEGEGKESSNEP